MQHICYAQPKSLARFHQGSYNLLGPDHSSDVSVPSITARKLWSSLLRYSTALVSIKNEAYRYGYAHSKSMDCYRCGITSVTKHFYDNHSCCQPANQHLVAAVHIVGAYSC